MTHFPRRVKGPLPSLARETQGARAESPSRDFGGIIFGLPRQLVASSTDAHIIIQ